MTAGARASTRDVREEERQKKRSRGLPLVGFFFEQNSVSPSRGWWLCSSTFWWWWNPQPSVASRAVVLSRQRLRPARRLWRDDGRGRVVRMEKAGKGRERGERVGRRKRPNRRCRPGAGGEPRTPSRATATLASETDLGRAHQGCSTKTELAGKHLVLSPRQFRRRRVSVPDAVAVAVCDLALPNSNAEVL